jgi:hypothetical protein
VGHLAMATGKARPEIGSDAVKRDWLDRVGNFVDEVKGWARASGWRTRRIDKTVSERGLGTYKVPVLLMEKDSVEVVLNPVAGFVPGANGAVDLYGRRPTTTSRASSRSATRASHLAPAHDFLHGCVAQRGAQAGIRP